MGFLCLFLGVALNITIRHTKKGDDQRERGHLLPNHLQLLQYSAAVSIIVFHRHPSFPLCSRNTLENSGRCTMQSPH